MRIHAATQEDHEVAQQEKAGGRCECGHAHAEPRVLAVQRYRSCEDHRGIPEPCDDVAAEMEGVAVTENSKPPVCGCKGHYGEGCVPALSTGQACAEEEQRCAH